ncbi:hypothetical protein N4G70_08185 [Streptomyces sp. ASQP_92]|uniref:hypothetical protein n=1 Tax=Streptomyces sp. ASQP_92 TaxID=2979116 RepID=UPI0021BEBB2E|nr:hypothetical protein [Streptomyces sp. ASQP_92]MCT9088845.1 hypothetical protein [Streptomyces sp. ASQP_92]
MVRDRDAFTKTGGQDPDPATVAVPAPNAAPAAPREQDASTASPAVDTAVRPAPPSAGATGRRTVPWRELPWLTLLLAVGIVAALAFIAGVLVEQHHLK